jgi:hypothetical protein
MTDLEYLASYGLTGDFGRFRSARPLPCQRGDRAVVRSARGLEIAEILRPAAPLHATFLPNTTVGQLLRLASPEDEQTAESMARRAGQLFEGAGNLAGELALPLALLDAEVLLDGQHGVLHVVRFAECDVRPFVSALAREFDLQITLTDLAHPLQGAEPEAEEEEDHGCGSCGSGGCGRGCGSGGCGTCGSADPHDVRAYFADLRTQMERRTPLL